MIYIQISTPQNPLNLEVLLYGGHISIEYFLRDAKLSITILKVHKWCQNLENTKNLLLGLYQKMANSKALFYW